MKTKNKINVLELISPEMKQVMQFYADNPQPTPENDGYPSMRLAYIKIGVIGMRMRQRCLAYKIFQ